MKYILYSLFLFSLPIFSADADEVSGPGLKPIELEWARVANAKTYRIQISSTAEFASTTVDEVASANKFTWTTYQPGTFFWRVAALTEGNKLGTWSAPAELDIKAKATTTEDFLSFDTEVSEGNKPATVPLSWKASSFAKSYEVEVWKAGGKKPILVQNVNVNTYAFTPGSFGSFYFRVKTRDKAGKALGDWSPQIPFNVNPKKSAPGISEQWFYPAGVVLYADDPTEHLTWPPCLELLGPKLNFQIKRIFRKN